MRRARCPIAFVLSFVLSTAWLSAAAAQTAGEERIIPPGADEDNSGPTPAEPAPPAAVPPITDTGTDDDSDWYQDFDVDAFLSAAYGHNFAFNNPTVTNVARLFDQQNDSFKLDIATLTVQWKARAPGEVGFRLDLSHGMVAPVVLGGIDVAVLQGYGRYVAPVGSGLTIDFGSFLSHIGSETVEGFETVNATYSHGLIFTLFTPPTLTGLRLGYAWERAVQATLWVVNGWRANVFDNNAGKTLGLQLNITPSEEFRLNVTYLAGPEQPGDNSDWRQMVNAFVEARPEDWLTTRVEGTFGHEAVVGGGPATQWWAVAAVLQAQMDVFGCVVRGEYVNNTDGFANVGAKIVEWTISPSVRVHEALLLRADVRQDRALDGVQLFMNNASSGTASQQTTVALNAILAY